MWVQMETMQFWSGSKTGSLWMRKRVKVETAS